MNESGTPIQEISFLDLAGRIDLSLQPHHHKRPAPRAAIKQQSSRWSETMRHGQDIQPCNIQIAILENAYLFVKDGIDGLIVTEKKQILRESGLFASMDKTEMEETIGNALNQDHAELPTIEVGLAGFDGAWTNYYHWIIFALTRSRLTLDLTDQEMPLLIPSYTHRKNILALQDKIYKKISYSHSVWSDSLRLFSLDNQIQQLADGCYRVKRLAYSWSDKPYPTAITEHPAFYSSIRNLSFYRESLQRNATVISPEQSANASISRRKICIIRESEPRIPAEVNAWLSSWLESKGVQLVQLEKLDLEQQIEIFNESSHIIAPHGAGLTNLILATSRVSILEFNRLFPGESRIRPWFYLLSANMSHDYWFIDIGDALPEATLKAGIQRFLDSSPKPWAAGEQSIPWADFSKTPSGDPAIPIARKSRIHRLIEKLILMRKRIF